MKAFVEITPSNRATYRESLIGSDVSVGRSPGCSISLPDVRELRAVHFVIEQRSRGCFVSLSKDVNTPFTFRGQSVKSETIPWGEEFYVNGVRFRLVRQKTDTTKKRTDIRFIIVACILASSAAWLFTYGKPTNDKKDKSKITPSPLFDEKAKCSRPMTAFERAREAEEAGFAKTERYSFTPQDGVEAVRLYSDAFQCYQVARQFDQANRVKKELDIWKRRIENDYRTHKLWLRLALDNKQNSDVLREVRVLESLLSHQNDRYTKWLDQLEQKTATR
jgi:hypothetical protein